MYTNEGFRLNLNGTALVGETPRSSRMDKHYTCLAGSIWILDPFRNWKWCNSNTGRQWHVWEGRQLSPGCALPLVQCIQCWVAAQQVASLDYNIKYITSACFDCSSSDACGSSSAAFPTPAWARLWDSPRTTTPPPVQAPQRLPCRAPRCAADSLA